MMVAACKSSSRHFVAVEKWGFAGFVGKSGSTDSLDMENGPTAVQQMLNSDTQWFMTAWLQGLLVERGPLSHQRGCCRWTSGHFCAAQTVNELPG